MKWSRKPYPGEKFKINLLGWKGYVCTALDECKHQDIDMNFPLLNSDLDHVYFLNPNPHLIYAVNQLLNATLGVIEIVDDNNKPYDPVSNPIGWEDSFRTKQNNLWRQKMAV
jgi:hypothetical protein